MERDGAGRWVPPLPCCIEEYSQNSLLSDCAACLVLPKDGMMRDEQSISCAPAA